jgi:ribonuclease Z
MFRHELKENAAEKKHMTAVQAAEIAKTAGGIKKMGLIHYSPRYIKSDLNEMLREAREVFPDTFLTRDGQHIPIENVD